MNGHPVRGVCYKQNTHSWFTQTDFLSRGVHGDRAHAFRGKTMPIKKGVETMVASQTNTRNFYKKLVYKKRVLGRSKN